MPDYEKMYFHLAGKMADAIETLDKVSRNLKIVQMKGEDMYIEDKETDETKASENVSQ